MCQLWGSEFANGVLTGDINLPVGVSLPFSSSAVGPGRPLVFLFPIFKLRLALELEESPGFSLAVAPPSSSGSPATGPAFVKWAPATVDAPPPPPEVRTVFSRAITKDGKEGFEIEWFALLLDFLVSRDDEAEGLLWSDPTLFLLPEEEDPVVAVTAAGPPPPPLGAEELGWVAEAHPPLMGVEIRLLSVALVEQEQSRRPQLFAQFRFGLSGSIFSSSLNSNVDGGDTPGWCCCCFSWSSLIPVTTWRNWIMDYGSRWWSGYKVVVAAIEAVVMISQPSLDQIRLIHSDFWGEDEFPGWTKLSSPRTSFFHSDLEHIN